MLNRSQEMNQEKQGPVAAENPAQVTENVTTVNPPAEAAKPTADVAPVNQVEAKKVEPAAKTEELPVAVAPPAKKNESRFRRFTNGVSSFFSHASCCSAENEVRTENKPSLK